MKLEIKHLAGYLPYGLKGMAINENLGIEIVKGFSTHGIFNSTINIITDIDNIDITLFKPILRPLLELEKEDWNGVFVNSDIDNILSIYQSDKHLGCVEYYLVNLLLSHHFDIYGLIENGLAIDINTLK